MDRLVIENIRSKLVVIIIGDKMRENCLAHIQKDSNRYNNEKN